MKLDINPVAGNLLVAACFLLIAACSGSSSEDSADTEDCDRADDKVDCVLNALGVDTESSPRQVQLDSNTRVDLPEDYTPLGKRLVVQKFDELLALNLTLSSDGGDGFSLSKLAVDNNNNYSSDVLFAPDEADNDWLGNGFRRAAVAADITGNGRDETVVVYRDNSSPSNPVRMVVIGDEPDGFTITAPRIIANATPTELVIEAGDFNGNGWIDLAVAKVYSDQVQLFFLENNNGTLEDSTWPQRLFEQQVYGNAFVFEMQAGNLDYGAAQQLAIMTNSYETSLNSGDNRGHARYTLLDSAHNDFEVLKTGPAEIPLDSGTLTLQTAGITLGDVTGNGVDEVIIGGLSHIGEEAGIGVENGRYAAMVLDIKPRDLAVIRTWTQNLQPLSGSSESGANRQMTYVHVNTLDLTGDGAREIQINQYILDNLRNSTNQSELEEIHQIEPSALYWPANASGSGRFHWRNTAMVTGDLTFDTRDNIAFVSTESDNVREIRIWGINEVDGWGEILAIPFNSDSGRPQLVAANVDDDSLALSYSEGTYRLAFTEPVIIAALAAAPCDEDFGQNLGDCRTAFGKGTSDTVSTEDAWSLSVGRSVGFEVGFSAFGVKVGGLEAVATVEAETRNFTEETYTLTRRVVHTTGPIEDSVIFTTIPLDVYTYVITSHPNEELIGGEMQVRMPRDPISVMTERTFYNERVDDEGFRIDSSIFSHTAGDPFSYPGLGERDSLLSQFDGLKSNEVDVGQGNGFVVSEVSVFEEVTEGTTYGINTSLDIRATTGGLITGVSIGGGVDSTISYGRGKESIYQGSVAQLPDSNFPDDAYRFGLFSYVYKDAPSQQEFEVINYWVRPQ
ncbi:MAG: hypothetical protein LAT62_16160 [Natronospirillum sp.]|uniref:hypothetical protein n=1 Tax=Natronospirillum sp. TaxID=2812955 RepID=UPI0025D49EA8|nr:hypothetical protein [Natronospirillum sp.]MCH8553472.1 hypothetical protein [Natronospirillum sp.]